MNRRTMLSHTGTVVIAVVAPAALIESASAKSQKAVIVAGGFGDTRAGFEKAYGKPKTDKLDDFLAAGDKAEHTDSTHSYYPAKTTLEFYTVFALGSDNKQRPTDQAFIITFDATEHHTMTQTEATHIALSLIPTDAKQKNDLAPTNDSGDVWQQDFSSATIKAALKKADWFQGVGNITISVSNDGKDNWSGAISAGED